MILLFKDRVLYKIIRTDLDKIFVYSPKYLPVWSLTWLWIFISCSRLQFEKSILLLLKLLQLSLQGTLLKNVVCHFDNPSQCGFLVFWVFCLFFFWFGKRVTVFSICWYYTTYRSNGMLQVHFLYYPALILDLPISLSGCCSYI